ncbi:hypothetical protein F4779DRAFT_573044 [Xylariaceae sp. FL0662B]|nr:hypothetical protein F4779DRAFT_573044 [Xylariaceae sp. FL0662B]
MDQSVTFNGVSLSDGSHHGKKPTRTAQNQNFTAQSRNRMGLPKLSDFLDWCQDTWMLEYSALALSAACMVSIFVVVLYFNNRSINEWHSYLSINTVLSILATALKSSTLLAAASALGQLKWAWYAHAPKSLQTFQAFDSASRGPFGAVYLLWNYPRSALVCLGSFIMILGLALDAAIQATTSRSLRSQTAQDATVPVTLNYNEDTFTGGVLSNIDPMLTDAFYTGLHNSEIILNYASEGNQRTTNYTVTPFCGTGNCTFEPYVSLAIQHRCLDMTTSLYYLTGDNTSFQDVTLTVSPTLPPGREVRNLTAAFRTSNYTATNNATNYDGFALEGRGVNTTRLAMSTSDPNYKTILAMAKDGKSFDSLPLVEISIIIINESSISTPSTKHFRAFRCSLDLGMQSFTSSIRNGDFIESPNEFSEGNWIFEPNQTRADNFGGFDYVGHWSLTKNISNKEFSVKTDYDLWASIAEIASEYISLNGTRRLADFIDVISMTEKNKRDFAVGMNDIFGAIAQSLSAYFRTVSGEVAIGTTESLEQYIEARWEWLLLPLVLVISNIIFVLTIRLQSCRLGLPSWRNSALALMFDEVSAETAELMEPVQQDHVFIGPPEAMKRTSELEMWAGSKFAKLRGVERRPKVINMAENDSLEDLG